MDTGSRLKPNQADIIDFIHETKRCVIADPPGVGKTAAVISAMPPGRVLVVAQLPVIPHWQ